MLGAGRASADDPPLQLSAPTPAPSTGVTFRLPQLWLPVGEPSGSGDLLPELLLEPLRLSLTGGIFPVASAYPQCDTRGDDAGNSEHGMPLQRAAFLRLSPRLTLHGFSSGGCPIDAGLGGGVTYAVPLRPSLWLVAGAGIYSVPGRNDVLAARNAAQVRLDLVKETKDSGTVRVGFEQKMGVGRESVPSITFGITR